MRRNDYALLIYCHEPRCNQSWLITMECSDWEVHFASSIDELFLKLKQRPNYFDILVIDVMAPVPQECNNISFTLPEIIEMREGMNTGVVCAKKIWKDLDRDYPIIFVSARNLDITSDQELNIHICDFLRKPFLERNLDQMLCDIINKYDIEPCPG